MFDKLLESFLSNVTTTLYKGVTFLLPPYNMKIKRVNYIKNIPQVYL